MAVLRLRLILLMAIMSTTTTVTEARPLSTTDEAKIATVYSSPHLINKVNGITLDKNINAINRLQRDFFMEFAIEEGNTMTLDRDEAPKRAIFPPSGAMTMPALTSANALELIEHLGVAPDSDMATAIATAAYLCGYGER